MSIQKVLTYGIIVAASFIYFMTKYSYVDEAQYGGDTWEYQSIGVNLALRGEYKFGNLLNDFSAYKFQWDAVELERNFKPRWDFYRTPLYPVFLSLVYRVFGVSPKIAKIVQALLLSISAGLLVFIARLHSKRFGFLCGIVAAALYVWFYAPNPTDIMSESLLLLASCLLAISFICWERSPNWKTSGILGICTGVLLLIKSFVFIPFFITWVFIFKFMKEWKKLSKLWLVFLLGIILTVSPWSIFASVRAKKPIILSTQYRYVLLDGNNELVIETGTWCPQWRKSHKNDKRFLYNRLDKKKHGTFEMLFLFLKAYREYIPKLIMRKIAVGFSRPSTLIPIILLFLYYFVWLVFKLAYPNSKDLKDYFGSVVTSVFFFSLLCNTIVLFGYLRYTYSFMPFFLILAVMAPIALLVLLKNYLGLSFEPAKKT